ncbi:MAG: hypothetical protein M3443_10565 [Actinomycetota bacterium]|nr:hypothetical protein [Actinomycetota bacterium]
MPDTPPGRHRLDRPTEGRADHGADEKWADELAAMRTTPIACRQRDIFGDDCVECQGPLGILPIPATVGYVCSTSCHDSQAARLDAADRAAHLRLRDLMCGCDTCAAAELPSAADRAEWTAYRAGNRDAPC